MKSITRRRGKGKRKVAQMRKELGATAMLGEIDDVDIKVWLLQAGMPAILTHVHEVFEEEVQRLAGIKGTHGKSVVRWGGQGGSIYLTDQKVPVRVPRVRNMQTAREVPLEAYHKLQSPRHADEQAYRKIINGVSNRKYYDAAALVPQVYGISASSVSQRFIKQASYALQQLQERRLDHYEFVVLFIDGKRFADDGVMISLGITLQGEKVILGLEQTATENSRAIEQHITGLKERGLNYSQGMLCVIDGSKGIHKAVKEAFKECAVIQRCQWHKIENVVSYLPKSLHALWRAKLRQAYAQHGYAQAKQTLLMLKGELKIINPSAAASLEEGFEETLTLHRLKVHAQLSKHLRTTNTLESVMAQVEQYTERVDRWHNGAQIQRWNAAALMEIEPRLNRVHGFRYLPLLQEQLRQELLAIKNGEKIIERKLVGV